MKHLILRTLMLFLWGSVPNANADDGAREWQQKVSSIVWVGYSPPTANPNNGVEVASKALDEDLALLRKAGFRGLLTYGSSGFLGRELPSFAEAHGFQGIIIGVWNPKSSNEISAAKAAAKSPVVLGICVGNEGLPSRYTMSELSAAIEELRQSTGKPVTTAQQIEHYSNPDLISVGDWIFPTVHPYFHRHLEPKAAAEWTIEAYARLKKKTDRFVWFKEVGLPTEGDPGGNLSEASQDEYYNLLAKSGVSFVYFEAFDLPWKKHLPVEPHWGIFRADRSPKLLGRRLLAEAGPSKGTVEPFYIYIDAGSKSNHFVPSGYMGDCGDIVVNEAWADNPNSPKTCIRVAYSPEGKGPHSCDYGPPCRWAGVQWQRPAHNWGTNSEIKGVGYDLSPYNRLVFWGRADKKCTIDFKVGGITNQYGDSLRTPRTKRATLNAKWQWFEIDLRGANLRHIIGGFSWTTDWEENPKGTTFYLDDIRFEK